MSSYNVLFSPSRAIECLNLPIKDHTSSTYMFLNRCYFPKTQDFTSTNFIYLFFFVQVFKSLPKKTCQSFSATNYEISIIKFYSCATELLNNHVNEWRIIVTEAIFHKNCLTNMCNKFKV